MSNELERGLERELAALAAYHAGLFTGAATRIDSDPGVIAHALFLLAEEALRRRDEWLASANRA